MTAVEHWVHRAHPVEALPLDSPADLHVAECWLRAHGLPVVVGRPSARHAVVVPGRCGFVARLGQVLCRDTVTGRFDAVDDDVFRGSHDPRAAEVRLLHDGRP